MEQKILIVNERGTRYHALFGALTRHFANYQIIYGDSVHATLSILHCAEPVALILLDFNLPDMCAFDALQKIRQLRPGVPVAIFADEENNALVDETLLRGGQGFISKTSRAEVVVSAIQLMMAGEIYIPRLRLQQVIAHKRRAIPLPPTLTPDEEPQLTPRQREVLRLMVEGYSNKEICALLNLSMGTIKTHCNAIFRDLNVTNRTQAALAARRVQLV